MPVSTEILAPVTALLLLTCVVWLWMYLTRIPAVRKAGMQLDPNLPKGQQMAELPAKVRWKADNYNHLLEQPTIFYAVAFTLALLGAGEGLNVTLAWCYVALRIAHSLQQTLWNKIEVRFVLFFLSSLVLVALVLRAALLIWLP
ncbi:MAG: MAPEG family protein [Halioglobus sp.]